MRHHKAFTLVEALVVLAIVLTCAALLYPAVARLFDHGPHNAVAAQDEPREAWTLTTVKHGGHWWIVGTEWGQHHPDCPCRKRQAEAD
jgi:prepilin-type N-terminal cleavage/methylation domain-containing protein